MTADEPTVPRTTADRRVAVLAALKARPEGVSGEVLAAFLGVSRVAIAKHISALREVGYVIEARVGAGYRLLGSPDLPIPEEVLPLLSEPGALRLHGGRTTTSTMDDARELAVAGAAAWSVVLASEQMTGRGRLGRTWESPLGGVYLSIILRPVVEPARVGSLGPAVALGVALGLERLGVNLRLKWPNDVLSGRGLGMGLESDREPRTGGGVWSRSDKIAGILLETVAESDAVSWVVAGIGINVRESPAHAALAALLPDPPRLAEVAAAVLEGVREVVATWAAEGFTALIDEWATRDALVGDEVVVRDLHGSVVAAGRVRGIDEEARLVLEDEEGRLKRVTSGEVTLRDEA